VWKDGRHAVRMNPEELNVRRETVRLILTDNLEMKKMRICSRLVSKNFIDDQVRQRREASADRSQRIEEHDKDRTKSLL
jgi:hypothetical protein